MQFGTHLHELWNLRRGVAIGAVLALLLAINSVESISLFPPGLHGRDLQIAAASTHVLVDSPQSRAIDFNSATTSGDIASLTQRAILLGNVMASLPVRQYIAARVGVRADVIQATAPITVSVPRALTEPGSAKRATDLLKSTNQYVLDIEANPTVPMLDIYAQAPTTKAADRLANGAVAGLRDYLQVVAAREGLKPNSQVALLQLGTSSGGVINGRINKELAILTFLVVFVIACCAVVFVDRVRRGWTAAQASERERAAADSLERLLADTTGANSSG